VSCFFIVPDETLPYITQTALDMGLGQLTLTFSEPVKVSTFYLPGLGIANAANENATILFLSSSVVVTSVGISLIVTV
jgi:hypothetical protein